MAITTKRKSKNWIEYTAARKISIEDDTHEAELAKGDTFFIGISKGNVQFIDPDGGQYYVYDVDPEGIGKVLPKQNRNPKQTISLAEAYNIVKAIYFPKLRKIKLVSKMKDMPRDVEGNWNPSTRVMYINTTSSDWVGTVLHEIIHQHLTEIGNEEPAHGKTFKRLSKQINANDIDWKAELKADLVNFNIDYTPFNFKDGQITNSNRPEYACLNEGSKIHKFYVVAIEPNNNIAFGMTKKGSKINIKMYQAELLLKPKPADIKEVKAMFGSKLEADREQVLRHLRDTYED